MGNEQKVNNIVKEYFIDELSKRVFPQGRAILSAVLTECVWEHTEDVIKQAFFALEGEAENAKRPKSWQMNPECLFYKADSFFCNEYSDIHKKDGLLLLPSGIQSYEWVYGEKKWEPTAEGKRLLEALHHRLNDFYMTDEEKKDFLFNAFDKKTDLNGAFRILQFSPYEKPAYLYNAFCKTYFLDADSFNKKVVSDSAIILDARNSYVGHRGGDVRDIDTVEKFTRALHAFVSFARKFHLKKDENLVNQFVADCNEIERKINCQPIPIKELQLIPGYRYRILVAHLSEYIDTSSQTLYLHTKKEITQLFSPDARHQEELAEKDREIEKLKAQLAAKNALLANVQIHTDDNGQQVVEKKNTATLPTFPSMFNYESGMLNNEQMEEIFSKCYVFADTNCWLMQHSCDFICNKVIPIQQKADGLACVLVDKNTQTEIGTLQNSENKETKKKATRVHEVWHKLHKSEAKPVKYYSKNPDGLTSRESMLDAAKRNPNQMICLLTTDISFCKQVAEKPLPNIIILCVMTNSLCTVHASCRKMVLKNCKGTNKPIISTAKPLPNTGNKPQESKKWVNPPKTQSVSADGIHTKDGTIIDIGEHIASGGEGDIYYTNTPGIVTKIYKKDKLTREKEDKLSLMVANNPHISNLCWPTEVLYNDKNQFIGYLMPLVGKEYEEFGKTVFNLEKKKVQQAFPQWNRLALSKLCNNICDFFDKLHNANILMGDVNPRNIMVRINTPEDPQIFVVDCDSFQIGNYHCAAGITDYLSPRILKMPNIRFDEFLRTKEDEQYAITILLFLILMLKRHPFDEKGDTDRAAAMRNNLFPYRFSDGNQNKAVVSGADVPDGPYALMWSCLPREIRKMFYETFKLNKAYSAKDWSKAFNSYTKGLLSGEYTKELKPKTYYDPEGKWTQSFTCSYCGETSNMPKVKWDANSNRFGKSFKPLCNDCLMLKIRLQKEETEIPCCGKNCHNMVKVDKWTASEVAKGLRKVHCEDCRYVEVTCPECGQSFFITTRKRKEFAEKSKTPLCKNCLQSKSWYRG